MSFMDHADLARAADIRVPGNKFRGALREVSEATGVSAARILGRSRVKQVVEARQLVCHILRRQGMSYPQIGRMMDRDHSTVLHSVRAVEARMASVSVAQLAPYMAPGVTLQDAIREAWIASIPDDLRPRPDDMRMGAGAKAASDRARKIRDAMADDITDMRKDGLRLEEIAARIGISMGTVKRIIREHNIPAPVRSSNPEREQRIFELLRQGLTPTEVAKATGCPRSTVIWVRSRRAA